MGGGGGGGGFCEDWGGCHMGFRENGVRIIRG